MRVLVVGSLPPPSGGHRASLLSEVGRLRLAGHEVTLLALDTLSVAHRYLPGPGLVSVAAVAAEGRRHDAVVLQLEPGLPVRLKAGQGERAAALMALAAVIRRLGPVTLRLDHLHDLPGGFGGRAAQAIWDAAARVEAGSELVHEALSPRVPAERLHLVAPGSVEPDVAFQAEEWETSSVSGAADVMAMVRKRAAEERRGLAAAGSLVVGSPGGRTWTRVSQWEWLPAPGAGVPHFDRTAISLPPVGTFRRFVTRTFAAAERRTATRIAAHAAKTAYRSVRRSVG